MKPVTGFSFTLSLVIALGLIAFVPLSPAYAGCGACASQGCVSAPYAAQCDQNCVQVSRDETDDTNEFIDDRFEQHSEWMVDTLFEAVILPNMQLMATQLTAAAMHQVMVIGAFLDAKHQLETQRLFQTMMAQAHKD